ncbi:hypothetical protein TTHERM_00382280 (macronuclear) [Tetrahymena thermophila SB210]|uniref:Uncharacterized protein n=1 Tax=Tetrahymena thermophila (strain SB210) TaxID=312017 RepID=Q23F86_TETTS|nr:hypothetical protein TTHERM_00382280 [Tetrahymena thermophila SB210]EAR95267.2 hypothetical protein TTHERM_00382280 [Tetrahymena thermophila SB210]|eukprot:XP_001015512.2 hypothetical protein TTHERM_00382280 [Tetrahymena thermophila SB210]
MQQAQAEFCQGNLLFFQQYQNPNELERHNSSTNNNMYLSPNFVPACYNQISLEHRASLCESSGKMSIENEPNGNLSNHFNPRSLDKNNQEEQKDQSDADNSEEHISLEKSFEKSPIFKKLNIVFNLDIIDNQLHNLPQNNILVDQDKDQKQEQLTQQEIQQVNQQQRLPPLTEEKSSIISTFLNNKNQQFMQNKIEEVVEQVFSSDQISVINNSNISRSEEEAFLINQAQQEEQNTFNQSIKTNSCFQNQKQQQQQKEIEQHSDDISNFHNIYEKMNRKKIKNNNEQAAVQLQQRLLVDDKINKNPRYHSAHIKEEKKQSLQTQQKNYQINQISNQQDHTLSSKPFLNNPLFSSNNFQSIQSNLLNPTIEIPSKISSTLFQNQNTLFGDSLNYQRDHTKIINSQSNKTSPNKMYDPFTFLQKSLEINQTLQQNLNQVHSIETLNQNTFDSLKEKVAQNNIQYQPQQQQNNLNNYQTKDLFEPYLKMCNFYEPSDQIDSNNIFINHQEYTEIQEKPSSSKQRANFLSEKNSDEQDQENFSDIESVSSNPNNTKSYISSQDDIDDLLRLDDIDLNDFSDVYCKQHNQNNSQNIDQPQENK